MVTKLSTFCTPHGSQGIRVSAPQKTHVSQDIILERDTAFQFALHFIFCFEQKKQNPFTPTGKPNIWVHDVTETLLREALLCCVSAPTNTTQTSSLHSLHYPQILSRMSSGIFVWSMVAAAPTLAVFTCKADEPGL